MDPSVIGCDDRERKVDGTDIKSGQMHSFDISRS
jgi:hypothetical protein